MKLMPHTPGRTSLSAAIAFALTAMAALPATSFAQEAAGTAVDTEEATPATPDAATLDTVQVTGYRYAIEQSLEQKRNANAIVEVITAEDVGKFPDKNVADALQRVPGVIVTRSGGEGKNVSVRGLSSELTLTQLNGNYIATAESNGDPTRSFNYMLLPSNMLSRAELFKTTSDDDDRPPSVETGGSLTGSKAGTANEAKGDPYILGLIDVIGTRWTVPTTIKDAELANLSADVCLTIDPGGNLTNFTFTRRSGNSQFDSSLEATLGVIRHVEPPPARFASAAARGRLCPTFSKQ